MRHLSQTLPHGPSLLFLAAAAFASLSLPGPIQAQPTQRPGTPMTNVQFPNTSLPVILLEYERLTGRKVIRDSSIQDRTLSIQTSGKLTYEQAAEFIEKSMLLNGYAIIPTNTPDQYKIVAWADKKPVSEGLPVMTNPLQLPPSDQVITYIMPLTYLTPEDAAMTFSGIVDLHPYGKITPLPNATAIVITESTSVIRKLIELRDHLDVAPMRTLDRVFTMERADAEEVVEALVEILDLEATTTTTSSANNGPLGQGQTQVVRSSGSPDSARLQNVLTSPSMFPRPTNPKPRVRAIQRTNQVLVVASPSDMEIVDRIIQHLDAPSRGPQFVKLKLGHIKIADFIEIASNALLRGREAEVQQAQGGTTGQNRTLETLQGATGSLASNTSFNSSSSSSSSSSSASGQLGNAGFEPEAPPTSIVIDKTVLIADNRQNMLIASGPPEQLCLLEELVKTMDVRPVQIQISSIIAQLNLSDDFEFGFDLLRSFDGPSGGIEGNTGGSFVSRTGQSRSLLDISSLTDVNNLIPAAQGLTMYGQLNPHLDSFLAALGSTNRFKVLSRPTIYTMNNQLAVIETGQRIAVPRSTLSSLDATGNNTNQIVTANIDFEDVVLRISVLPMVNSDGEVTLQIQQRNDDIVGSQFIGGDEVPTIGTQALGTTVITRDGGTVLLGGLISEADSKAESGLPLFANLPLVGRVFGSTADRVERQELLIFIQPRIICHDRDYERVDGDMLTRTRVGEEAVDFGENTDSNLELFETQDFNAPDERINFFENMFQKNLFRKNRQNNGANGNHPSAYAKPVGSP